MSCEIRGLKLFTTREAAKKSGISLRRIQQFCQMGLIGIQVDDRGFYLIAEDELVKFMKERGENGIKI
jgi:predicted site-specific integrase-resolvase